MDIFYICVSIIEFIAMNIFENNDTPYASKRFFQILNVKDERKFFAYSIFLLYLIQVLSYSISLHFLLFYNYFFLFCTYIDDQYPPFFNTNVLKIFIPLSLVESRYHLQGIKP